MTARDEADAPKGVVRRFYAILDDHKPDALREICAQGLVGHAGAGSNLDELIENWRAFQASFPDLRAADIRHLVAEGEMVAAWVQFEGTHDGDFAGVPASGRRVRFAGWDFFRIRGGQIVELTEHCDLFRILNQIGALPTATPG